MRSLFLLSILMVGSSNLFAQSVYYPDCMLGALGLRVSDSTTRQILANAAIYLQASDSTKKEVMNAEGGYKIEIRKGIVQGLKVYNNGVLDTKQYYKAYPYVLPLGLTFADSVGVEDNLLFNQDFTTATQSTTGEIRATALLLNGKRFRVASGFSPAWYYFGLSKDYLQKSGFSRNQYFAFSHLPATASGKFLSMPQSCGSYSADRPTIGSQYSFVDSLAFLDIWLGFARIGAYPVRQYTNGGLDLGFRVRAPVSRQKAWPLMHIFAFQLQSHSYQGFSDVDNGPTFNSFSLDYGLSFYPFKTVVLAKSIRPFFDITTGPVLFSNSKFVLADSLGGGRPRSLNNLSWQYKMGGGIAIEAPARHFISLGVYYGQALSARYYRIDQLGSGNPVFRRGSTPFGSLNFRVIYSIRLL